MTCREAIIQALVECGVNPDQAQMKATMSDAILPDAAGSHALVRPGLEREFIDFLKSLYHQMEDNPQIEEALWAKMNERTMNN